MATSTRSWDYPWKSAFAQYVPLTANYEVYDALREGFPFVDAALRKLARLCGGFSVESGVEATDAQINRWLSRVRVLDVLRGWETFSYSFINSLLQYGKACGEIVLTRSGRDIHELVPVCAKRLRLVQCNGSLALGEASDDGQVEVYPNQELFVYSALNIEGDTPHGVSLLRSLPFVANVALVMENATRQKWQRQGAPAFLLVDRMPPDMLGADRQAAKRTEEIKQQWNAAMRSRWEAQGIMDFVMSTQGDFTVRSIGADTQELEFKETLRSLQEQIVASVELAPFMLGLQWSATERMSSQQADMVIAVVNAVRREVEPSYLRVAEWYRRLHGLPGELQARWALVSLQDVVETARAEWYRARAERERKAARAEA